MLAADPDEYNAMLFQIEEMAFRIDALSTELSAAQANLANQSTTIDAAVRGLVTLKERLVGLNTCVSPDSDTEIGVIWRDVDGIVAVLKKEASLCTSRSQPRCQATTVR